MSRYQREPQDGDMTEIMTQPPQTAVQAKSEAKRRQQVRNRIEDLMLERRNGDPLDG